MNPLVSVSWLADRLNDSQIVVLDATLPPVGVTPPVDTRGRYLERHIPGAVFFDIDELSDHSTSLPHMLPTEEEFSRKMGELGIGNEMTIAVYEQAGVFSAPRAWWMLRTFGVDKVHVLDGGLDAWTAAGLPVESGTAKRAEVKFTARLDRSVVKSFEQVQKMIAAHAQILDARSAGRFAGTAPEPRPGISSGHMPGATSVPFTELTETGRMKDADGLRELFAAKKVNLDQPITTTCGSGVTAAVIALGLEIAGAKQVNLYDGSWAEYASRPEAVIEKD
ncbi:3-mercaptopyruvate sulfurtransferase [Edaphobacter albus]|uniref:3-mercaptopyruvate sulfurtransferase n=1 Tax=Edaphobacter sp. 4G125 TaxID=2763071 RepID=UPI001648FCD1|nr:3-mercaptopyruvate sulfurtransferase [Edaphobacter sp. 4G125]QNI36717.1 3-mercaptopyruvate sulfurtransferase [Edaphobacter sp. 4G125]